MKYLKQANSETGGKNTGRQGLEEDGRGSLFNECRISVWGDGKF